MFDMFVVISIIFYAFTACIFAVLSVVVIVCGIKEDRYMKKRRNNR